MTTAGYREREEPDARGSAAPVAEVLGTDRPTGRTRSSNPSQPASAGRPDPRFNLNYFDPPADLQRHILALFHFEWSDTDIVDRHPGVLGQLFMTPYGSGSIAFGDRRDLVDARPLIYPGFRFAAPFRIQGPWHAFGVSLSPLGWAALVGRPANLFLDQFTPASELIDPEIDRLAASLVERYRAGKLSGEGACEELVRFIRPRLKMVPSPHEQLIEQTLAWLGSSLNPDMTSLFELLAFSRRQAERLITHYFGLPPAALARKMRAIRAAELLAHPALSDEGAAEIAEAFHDQPHMIREIRRYCGYTPSQMRKADEPLLQRCCACKIWKSRDLSG
jgi:AraC-like DNA-binding protein